RRRAGARRGARRADARAHVRGGGGPGAASPGARRRRLGGAGEHRHQEPERAAQRRPRHRRRDRARRTAGGAGARRGRAGRGIAARRGGGVMPDKDIVFATEDTYHHGYAQKQRAAFSREVLSFALGGEEYAIDILRIREILKHRAATEVPRAPAFILGVIAVRGQIIPVMDLRLRVRVAAAPPAKESRILVVTHAGEAYGLLVDAVHQVVRMRDEDVEPPPALLG